MRPFDYFRLAGENIAAAKMRTFLTALGIIIGIGAVITMLAIGQGVSSTVVGAFQDMGANRLTILPAAPVAEGQSRRGLSGGLGGQAPSTLTVSDAEALRTLDDVTAVAPVLPVPVSAGGSGTELRAVATGTSPAYLEIAGSTLEAGRVFVDGAAEIVLNAVAAELLFPTGTALGSQVTLNGQSFSVVGIVSNDTQLSRAAASFGRSDDGEPEAAPPALYVPASHARNLAGTETVSQILLTVSSPEITESVQERARSLLSERHGVEDFRLISAQEMLEGFTQVFNVLTIGLAAIAGISLLVGGIGIMNIMLVSVTERTREIGIVKALGATQTHIILQFLLEAVLLSLVGGLLGLGLAWAGTFAAQAALGLPALVTPTAVVLAIGISAGIGLFFGVAPAWRAARLDPIVALRHD